MDAPDVTLSFSLHDIVKGEEVTPMNVDMVTLHQFLGEVIDIIRGETKPSEMGKPLVTITNGSVLVSAIVAASMAAGFQSDMLRLATFGNLDEISPKRASVISHWQSRSLEKGSKRSYTIFPEGVEGGGIDIGPESNYRSYSQDKWIMVERTVTGTVNDMGGKTKPNIHITTVTGSTLKIGAKEDQIAGKDYLYNRVNMTFRGSENIDSGELRDLKLVEVRRIPDEIDLNQLEALWANGRRAWKDVASATDWVESIR